jgi:hypothetical protein
MPANLNALIRYKTLNSCLYGGKRKWRMDELVEACSAALAEARGRYEPISERTVRDDIRVMRSDILGFNAPIKQQGGLYFYSDPRFSILSINISDNDLTDSIINLLLELRTEVSHPELEIILKKLMSATGRSSAEPLTGTFENYVSESQFEKKKFKINIRKSPGTKMPSVKASGPKPDFDIEYQGDALPETWFLHSDETETTWGDVLGIFDHLQKIN